MDTDLSIPEVTKRCFDSGNQAALISFAVAHLWSEEKKKRLEIR